VLDFDHPWLEIATTTLGERPSGKRRRITVEVADAFEVWSAVSAPTWAGVVVPALDSGSRMRFGFAHAIRVRAWTDVRALRRSFSCFEAQKTSASRTFSHKKLVVTLCTRRTFV
jgi:hypothetical protein